MIDSCNPILGWQGGQANGQADVVIGSGLHELDGRNRIQIWANSWTVWNKGYQMDTKDCSI